MHLFWSNTALPRSKTKRALGERKSLPTLCHSYCFRSVCQVTTI